MSRGKLGTTLPKRSSKQVKPAVGVKQTPGQTQSEKESWPEFARKVKIRSGRRLVDFVPYKFQVLLFNLIEKHYGTVITKTRQVGLTEFVACRFLWKAYQDPGYLGVVFSKGQDDTTRIAKRVRLMVSSHPGIELVSENTKHLELKDGGSILFRPSTTNAARGVESASEFLFDEAGFVREFEEIYGSSLPAAEMLGDDARVIVLSTPNGKQGLYWNLLSSHNGSRNILDICKQVREGEIDPCQWWIDEEGWVKFVIHWRAHPVYSQRPNYLAKIKQDKRLTDRQIFQEYNLGFEDAENAVYSSELVVAGAVGIWCPAMSGQRYGIGIDPNFGGSDPFAAEVWDITEAPYELVNEYRDKHRSKDYNLEKVCELVDAYKPYIISVETNSGGRLYQEEIAKKYPNIDVKGVCTGSGNKIVNTDRLGLLLERGHLVYPKGAAIEDELISFTETIAGKNRWREAASGKTDDCIMATAALFAWIDEFKKSIKYTSCFSSESDIMPTYDRWNRNRPSRHRRYGYYDHRGYYY